MSATFELSNLEVMDRQPVPLSIAPAVYLQRKRAGVRLLGGLLSVPLAPIILLLMGAVRVTSPGPGLYRQRRVGLHGREFTIYKLRSMRQDAEKLCGPVWAAKRDSRVTPFGRFLRWSHLDELPQIINVVRGEMDFVGPRPERPEIVDELIPQVQNYQSRHDAMPGITGIAQVNLEPDQEIECVCKKVAADLYYLEYASLWLDIRLITATVLRVLGLRYHHGARLLGVTLPEHVLEGALARDNSWASEDGENPPEDRDSMAPPSDIDDTRVYASLAETLADELPQTALPESRAAPLQHRAPR